MRLSHVCLNCRDYALVSDFFQQVFSATVAYYFERNGQKFGVFLRLKNRTYIELFNVRKRPRRMSKSSSVRHICLATDSLTSVERRLQSRGIFYSKSVGRQDRVPQLMVRGPEGILVEVHQRKT